MSMARMYFHLIASLPRLPYFARAEFLPITRLRLQQRLRLLEPADEQQFQRVLELVRWRPRQVVGGDDASLLTRYRGLADVPLHPELRRYLDFRMQQRTLLAAVRRKNAGLEEPGEREIWGAEPLAASIRRRWDEPAFGLAGRFRWLPEAQALLAAGDARGLEKLLVDGAWRELTRIGERDMFGFPAVFAYAAKWDLLQAWLAGDPEQGRMIFKQLIDQVTHVDNAS